MGWRWNSKTKEHPLGKAVVFTFPWALQCGVIGLLSFFGWRTWVAVSIAMMFVVRGFALVNFWKPSVKFFPYFHAWATILHAIISLFAAIVRDVVAWVWCGVVQYVCVCV